MYINEISGHYTQKKKLEIEKMVTANNHISGSLAIVSQPQVKSQHNTTKYILWKKFPRNEVFVTLKGDC